jgi:hypothetical protein
MSEEKYLPETQSAPALRDKRSQPEGVVPKQAQGYVIAGLAVLILMAVMFSKNHAKPSAKEPLSLPMTASNDMNQRKIKELEQDLSADQKQSQLAQKVTASTTTSTTNPALPTQLPGTAGPSAVQMPPASDPPRDPVKDAERELAFKSRFASNLVSGEAQPPVGQITSSDAAAQRTLPQPQQASASQPIASASKHGIPGIGSRLTAINGFPSRSSARIIDRLAMLSDAGMQTIKGSSHTFLMTSSGAFSGRNPNPASISPSRTLLAIDPVRPALWLTRTRGCSSNFSP